MTGESSIKFTALEPHPGFAMTLTPVPLAPVADLSTTSRRRSVARLIEPLEELTRTSPYLLRTSVRTRPNDDASLLPRYIFLGPRGGDAPIRIGIFASIHGDEPEGAQAVVEFIQQLDQNPTLATGYVLFIYPVCNPHGFENDSRYAQSGRDLNREFWNNSEEPEVQLLQDDLTHHGLQGILSLHSDDTSEGLYGFVRGVTLSKHLLEPALARASRFLPRNQNPLIDGFPATNGIIHQGYPGILSPPRGMGPRPFEIVFETPATAPAAHQRQAFLAALHSVLEEYRKFMSYGANL